LVLTFSVLLTLHHATISRFKIKLFFKSVSELHVSAYSAIIRFAEIQKDCCAFYTTAIGGFAFITFYKPMQFLLLCHMYCLFGMPVAYQVCSEVV
jgi:hypothetical protein